GSGPPRVERVAGTVDAERVTVWPERGRLRRHRVADDHGAAHTALVYRMPADDRVRPLAARSQATRTNPSRHWSPACGASRCRHASTSRACRGCHSGTSRCPSYGTGLTSSDTTCGRDPWAESRPIPRPFSTQARSSRCERVRDVLYERFEPAAVACGIPRIR